MFNKVKIAHVEVKMKMGNWRLRNTMATLRSPYAIIRVGGLRPPTDTPPPPAVLTGVDAVHRRLGSYGV